MPIYTHTHTYIYIYIYMSPMKYIDKYIYSVTGQLVRSVVRLAARWLSVFVGPIRVFVHNSASAASLQLFVHNSASAASLQLFVHNSASAASLQQAKLPTNVHLKCKNISLLTNPVFFSFSIYIQNLKKICLRWGRGGGGGGGRGGYNSVFYFSEVKWGCYNSGRLCYC